MPSPAVPPTVVHRFERVEVRPAQRQLLVDGEAAPLGARAFDLLLALIEHRDRVVSKNELLDIVWPGLVVEENNLQVQVSTLRKVLGAKAIATVPGRGYRFTLAGEASPIASLAAREVTPRYSIPERIGQMLGREDDLRALLDLIGRHPLVSLVGPGGIGKTTLARHAAQTGARLWPDGCAWVELASLADGRLIAGSVAQALGVQLAPGADAVAELVAALKPMQLLLVLDNAEHLVDTLAPVLDAVRTGAPGVHLLVTTQTPLKLAAEQVLRLEALTVPQVGCNAEAAAAHGAVALFADRARAADRRFALSDDNVAPICEICQRLDGLPLAIELAAARVPMLGVRGVLERLDDRFKLLAGGHRAAPTRHQTLQAALDWSLALLPQAERHLFRQLGVFAGGFTLELAVDVLAGDALDEWTLIDALAVLADHSLLGVNGDADIPRYSLSETARAYALSSSAGATLPQARHAQAMCRLFDKAPADWLVMTDAAWLARYEPELDNLRAALEFSFDRRESETTVSLVGAAAPLWHHLSLYDEARHWHERSEALMTSHTPAPLAARWWRAAQWAWAATDSERARAAGARAQALYRQIGDVHGLYAELTGLAGLWREPNAMAEAALAEALSLERQDWPARERAWGQRARADVTRAAGRLAESRLAREAELVLRTQAGDERGRLRAMALLAELAHAEANFGEARTRWEALIAQLRTRRSAASLASALRGLARALAASGYEAQAETHLAEAATLAPASPLA